MIAGRYPDAVRGLRRLLLIGFLAAGLGLSLGCAGLPMEMADSHHGAPEESMTMCVPDPISVAAAAVHVPEPPHRPFTMLLESSAPPVEKPVPPNRAPSLSQLCVSLT